MKEAEFLYEQRENKKIVGIDTEEGERISAGFIECDRVLGGIVLFFGFSQYRSLVRKVYIITTNCRNLSQKERVYMFQEKNLSQVKSEQRLGIKMIMS